MLEKYFYRWFDASKNKEQKRKLPLTIAVGVFIALMPFPGISTIACSIAAVAFRLNFLLIQTLNYLLFPIQILLFIPFLKIGEYLFSSSFNNYHPITTINIQTLSFVELITQLSESLLVANLLYFCIAIPISFLVYFISRILLLPKQSLANIP